MKTDVIIKDLVIGLLQKFWTTKDYVREDTNAFLKTLSLDLIRDLEQTPSVDENRLLIQILSSLQGENVSNALIPLANALKNLEYWKPESGSEVGPVKILADQIITLLRGFGPSSIDILIDAFLDDSAFDHALASLHGKREGVEKGSDGTFPERALILSYKVIKNQRLKDEIERHGHYALEKIAERLKKAKNDVSEIKKKLQPLYEKLTQQFSIDQKFGFSVLL